VASTTITVKLDAEDLLRRLGLAIKRINELEHEHLNSKFIEAMNDIGRYGFEKYGPLPRERSAHRDPSRVTSDAIAEHADDHFHAYLRGIPHDHFNTRRHQLAAVAFNAMMEFHFAGLDMDPWEL
jgi:hypothetical protein